MNSPLTFLGVDIGAESGRLMAGLWDGSKITLLEQHRFPNSPVALHQSLRWDLLHLWKNIQDSLSLAARHFGSQVRSIGVDTWGVDYVLMDARGEWLGIPHAYRDVRTRGLVEEVLSILPRETIFAESGTQFLEINTLYQLLAAHRADPALLENARRLLMIPDWIHWALCGSTCSEFSNATTTQLVHPKTRSWSTSLLDRLGMPSHFLPPIVLPGSPLGTLLPEVAHASGLAQIPVIAPGTHDTASAVAAVPTKLTGSPRWAYISSGTWSLIGTEVPEAILTRPVQDTNFTNEGGVDGTYRLLRNSMGMWLIQQLRKALAQNGHAYDYAELVQLAAHADPFRSLIDPDDPRLLRPTDFIPLLQSLCRETQQPIPESPGALVRCILESLALRYRQVIGWIESITGTPIEVIHIVGGGSRNTLLNQFTADATGRPVIAGPVEATALGNVLVQGRACGEIDSLQDLRQVVSDSFHHEMREFLPCSSQRSPWDSAAHAWSARFCATPH
ncbi:MAG: Rhamnulokinase [Verrucomicrobiota bacterium]|jgi:rhamnulokinase